MPPMSDYLIYEYDGDNIMFSISRSSVFPDGTVNQKISLANLKNNEFMKLDFSCEGTDIV